MKDLQMSEDILPVGEFKTHASRVIRRLQATKRPFVITQNGKPAAVLLTPAEFDRLNEHARFLEAIDGIEGVAFDQFFEKLPERVVIAKTFDTHDLAVDRKKRPYLANH